jgi:hypothetical protein
MKNFLIEFFRPLDNLIFNYLVKIGAVKPFLSALIGGAKAFLGSKAGGAIAGQAISGALGSRSARKASQRAAGTIERAYGELRDPSEIISEAYQTGIYSPETMGAILGAEREFIPQFQELAELRARGIRGIQEESKLRQLGLLGELGADIRGTLEDPRLAKLAGLDVAEAERLTAEAAGPLGVEAARTAEQTALGLGQQMGRVGDASTLARAALGRESAQRARRLEAAGARQRALQSATAAMVDPSAFLFTPSAEERIFASTPLGAQVTDPGMAATLGSAVDVQRAQALLGQGLAQAQGAAASGQILGQTIGGIGSILGGMDFGSRGASPMGTVGQGTVLATPAQTAGANLISGFQKLFP